MTVTILSGQNGSLTSSFNNIFMPGNRILTISSENEKNIEEKKHKYTRKEYNYSSFSRSFKLTDDVNKDKIEAAYDNGILKLSLLKNGWAYASQTISVAVK